MVYKIFQYTGICHAELVSASIIEKVSKLVGKEVSKKLRNIPLAPLGRADLRTDGAKRVRLANRLSGMHESAKAKLCEHEANPRQGVPRTGEGLTSEKLILKN